jgi:hypothetical protein
MPAILIAFIVAVAALATPAQAANCRVLGAPDTSVPLYGRPAGSSTGSVKAGLVMNSQGGGHDTTGRTWVFVSLGGNRGWIERSNLSCSN